LGENIYFGGYFSTSAPSVGSYGFSRSSYYVPRIVPVSDVITIDASGCSFINSATGDVTTSYTLQHQYDDIHLIFDTSANAWLILYNSVTTPNLQQVLNLGNEAIDTSIVLNDVGGVNTGLVLTNTNSSPVETTTLKATEVTYSDSSTDYTASWLNIITKANTNPTLAQVLASGNSDTYNYGYNTWQTVLLTQPSDPPDSNFVPRLSFTQTNPNSQLWNDASYSLYGTHLQSTDANGTILIADLDINVYSEIRNGYIGDTSNFTTSITNAQAGQVLYTSAEPNSNIPPSALNENDLQILTNSGSSTGPQMSLNRFRDIQLGSETHEATQYNVDGINFYSTSSGISNPVCNIKCRGIDVIQMLGGSGNNVFNGRANSATTANSAISVAVNLQDSPTDFNIAFVGATSGTAPIYVGNNLTYDPSRNILSCPYLQLTNVPLTPTYTTGTTGVLTIDAKNLSVGFFSLYIQYTDPLTNINKINIINYRRGGIYKVSLLSNTSSFTIQGFPAFSASGSSPLCNTSYPTTTLGNGSPYILTLEVGLFGNQTVTCASLVKFNG
jgi:hypothetical protein